MTSKADYRDMLDAAGQRIDALQAAFDRVSAERDRLRADLSREKAAHTSTAFAAARRRQTKTEWGEDRIRVSRDLPPEPGVVVASKNWSLAPDKALEIFAVWANGTDLPMSTNPAHLAAWLDKHRPDDIEQEERRYGFILSPFIVPAIRWDEADEWAATIGAEHHLPVDMNLALAYQTLKREHARLTVALGRIKDDPTNARQIATVALR